MENKKFKKIIIFLILLIVIQNGYIFYKNQRNMKNLLSSTENYLTGCINHIDYLIDGDFSDITKYEDYKDSFDQNIDLGRDMMPYINNSISFFNIYLNNDIQGSYNYFDQNRVILQRIREDNILDDSERGYLKIIKDELIKYKKDIVILQQKKIFTTEKVNETLLSLDSSEEYTPFKFISRFEEYIKVK